MRAQTLFILIVLITIGIGIIYATGLVQMQMQSDGFSNQDLYNRVNPLAQAQNPLKNPAVPIGIPAALGASLTAMNVAALNMPTISRNASGSVDIVAPTNTISPRVDNDASLLGLVKMCKEKGVGDTPFSDPAFAANCGMCLTNGSLVTGETFKTPTGVLVYAEDKAVARSDMVSNGNPFPRVIPSMKAATCAGATKNPTGDAAPTLAISQKDFTAFKKRQACRDSHKIGEQCGICMSNKEISWVSAAGGRPPMSLVLWGSGTVQLKISGKVVLPDSLSASVAAPATANATAPAPATAAATAAVTLKEDVPLLYTLGLVKEGTTIQIDVNKAAAAAAAAGAGAEAYLFGVLTSKNPNQTMYKLPIEKFMENPRKGAPMYFAPLKIFTAKIMPPPGAPLSIRGFIPLTFVESDDIAAYDCPSAPFITTTESAEIFITDPCLKPKGQGPNTYTNECMQDALLKAGCSTDGAWYKNISTIDKSQKISDFIMEKKRLNEKSGLTDPAVSMGCRGVDISTPCDAYLNGGVPNKECLTYLYSNQSSKSVRVGTGYPGASMKFTSGGSRNAVQFCQQRGSLNPQMQGPSELSKIAGGYKGYSGIEAVKQYLTDVFTKATGNLDINKSDADGGRKDSWNKCFGYKIEDSPISQVITNAKGEVSEEEFSCAPFPKSYVPSRGKVLSQSMNVTSDYILSFTLTPRGTINDWSSLFHFTADNTDISQVPSVYVKPGSTALSIRVGDSIYGKGWGIDSGALPMGQASTFRLECKGKSIRLSINDKVQTATQPGIRYKGPAKVYSGDPWYPAANVLVEKLCYTIL